MASRNGNELHEGRSPSGDLIVGPMRARDLQILSTDWVNIEVPIIRKNSSN